MDRGVIDKGERVIVDTLVGVSDGEISDGFREDGYGDLAGVSTLSLVVIDEESYGIGAGLNIGMLWFEAVIDGRTITKVPGVSGVTCYGAGREIFEDKEVVVKTLRAVVDGEFSFWREVDDCCFGKGVNTAKRRGYFELYVESTG